VHRAVVTSPLQLLHAGEAVETLGIDRDELLLTVVLPGERTGSEQLRAVFADDPWPHTEWLVAPNVVRKLWWLAGAGRRPLETLIVGEYRLDLLRELASRTRPATTVLVDDGNATRFVARRRAALAAGEPPPPLRLAGTGTTRQRAHRVVGVRGPDPSALVYCTIYDLPVAPPDRVVRHTYARLRRRHPPPAPERGTAPALFLGSNLVETGILSETSYRSLVAAAVAQTPRPERYVPHRRERREKVEALARAYDLTVADTRLPIELELATAPQQPARVYATLSSALETLRVVFDHRLPISALLPATSAVAPDARANYELTVAAWRDDAGPDTETTIVP
jgi:hypothetical protein